MKMKELFGALLCFFLLCFAAASISQAVDETACQETIQITCTSCHKTGRICRELDNKDADWPAIIKEMGELGDLSQDIQNTALNCLTKADNPKSFACKK